MSRIFTLLFGVIFFILSNSSAHARISLGEWESSGDLEMPYTPTGPINYNCTIEVSLSHEGKSFYGRTTHKFTTADFVDSGASFILGKHEKWTLHSMTSPSEARALLPLTAGQSLRLSFRQGEPGHDSAVLVVGARLALKGETLASSASTELPRSEHGIYSTTNIRRESNSGANRYSHLTVSAECEE